MSLPTTEGYSYDGLGRLTGTRSYNISLLSPYGYPVEDGIRYDKAGNILSLKRHGLSGLSENLGYVYDGGRLLSVRDTVQSRDYSFTYDEAGNVTKDDFTGLTYRYNVIGKVSEIGKTGIAPGTGPILEVAFVDSTKISYLADGTKLEAARHDGTATVYRGSFILHRSQNGDVSLETEILPDGIAVPVGNSLKMFTFVKDHLGSTRTVVDMQEGAVCEENDYYAFGMKIPAVSGPQLIENRWRYSGKEEQDAVAGIPYIDYGARLYDARIGRWLSPDPLAEKYFSLSLYNYCGDDPINRFDPDGNAWFQNTKTGEIYYNKSYTQLDAGKGYMNGNSFWTFLAENNTFSIPDNDLLAHSTQFVQSMNDYSFGVLFNSEAAASTMHQVGMVFRPTQAIVDVCTTLQTFPDGMIQVAFENSSYSVVEVELSKYVPEDYNQTVKKREILKHTSTKIDFWTSTTTSIDRERQTYSYSTNLPSTELPLKEVFIEILKNIVTNNDFMLKHLK